jgi:hypothetical protein
LEIEGVSHHSHRELARLIAPEFNTGLLESWALVAPDMKSIRSLAAWKLQTSPLSRSEKTQWWFRNDQYEWSETSGKHAAGAILDDLELLKAQTGQSIFLNALHSRTTRDGQSRLYAVTSRGTMIAALEADFTQDLSLAATLATQLQSVLIHRPIAAVPNESLHRPSLQHEIDIILRSISPRLGISSQRASESEVRRAS